MLNQEVYSLPADFSKFVFAYDVARAVTALPQKACEDIKQIAWPKSNHQLSSANYTSINSALAYFISSFSPHLTYTVHELPNSNELCVSSFAKKGLNSEFIKLVSDNIQAIAGIGEESKLLEGFQKVSDSVKYLNSPNLILTLAADSQGATKYYSTTIEAFNLINALYNTLGDSFSDRCEAMVSALKNPSVILPGELTNEDTWKKDVLKALPNIVFEFLVKATGDVQLAQRARIKASGEKQSDTKLPLKEAFKSLSDKILIIVKEALLDFFINHPKGLILKAENTRAQEPVSLELKQFAASAHSLKLAALDEGKHKELQAMPTLPENGEIPSGQVVSISESGQLSLTQYKSSEPAEIRVLVRQQDQKLSFSEIYNLLALAKNNSTTTPGVLFLKSQSENFTSYSGFILNKNLSPEDVVNTQGELLKLRTFLAYTFAVNQGQGYLDRGDKLVAILKERNKEIVQALESFEDALSEHDVQLASSFLAANTNQLQTIFGSKFSLHDAWAFLSQQREQLIDKLILRACIKLNIFTPLEFADSDGKPLEFLPVSYGSQTLESLLHTLPEGKRVEKNSLLLLDKFLEHGLEPDLAVQVFEEIKNGCNLEHFLEESTINALITLQGYKDQVSAEKFLELTEIIFFPIRFRSGIVPDNFPQLKTINQADLVLDVYSKVSKEFLLESHSENVSQSATLLAKWAGVIDLPEIGLLADFIAIDLFEFLDSKAKELQREISKKEREASTVKSSRNKKERAKATEILAGVESLKARKKEVSGLQASLKFVEPAEMLEVHVKNSFDADEFLAIQDALINDEQLIFDALSDLDKQQFWQLKLNTALELENILLGYIALRVIGSSASVSAYSKFLQACKETYPDIECFMPNKSEGYKPMRYNPEQNAIFCNDNIGPLITDELLSQGLAKLVENPKTNNNTGNASP